MNTTTHKQGEYRSDSIISNIYNQDRDLYQKLCDKKATIALVGLGYVGLPIALEFAKSFKVIGYDINESRIEMMKKGVDPSGELLASDFDNKDIQFTSMANTLDKADVIVVAVPTPVSKDNSPNLTPLSKACEAIGVSIGKGNIVTDFWVGYSPERINPGDKVNTLTNITKIVSGSNEYAQREIYNIYNHIIDAGIHIAPSIKVAEAAKIVENTQRDVNIALMNELSGFFDKLDINTHEVLAAAGTKWNFLNFYPGLVGGHW